MAEAWLIATLVFLAAFAALRAPRPRPDMHRAGASGASGGAGARARGWAWPGLGARGQASRRRLAEWLAAAGGYLRAGATLPQALRWLADGADDGGEPLLRAAARAERGDWAGALEELAGELAAEDAAGLRAAVEVHRLTGGQLGPILERWAEACRDALEREAELRARTAEARGSALVLALTPLGMAGYVAAFHPGMWRALGESGLGLPALAYAAVSWLAGVATIHRLLRRVAARASGGGHP